MMKDVQLTMEEKKKIFQAIMPIWERFLFDTASAYNLELVLGDGGLTELCFHPVEIPEGVVMLSSVDSAPEKKEVVKKVEAPAPVKKATVKKKAPVKKKAVKKVTKPSEK